MTGAVGERPPGNIGAAIGALLPLVAGGAVLLHNPSAPPPAPPPPLAVRVVVAPPPAPLTPEAVAAALAPPPPGSATPECLARFTTALPQQVGDRLGQRETLVCRRGYVLGFDADTHDPDWVMERLAPTDLVGPAKRTDQFRPDPVLPKTVDADNPDYLSSGFDRGHQAAAGDAKFSQDVMNQSFFFSNMAPQVGIGFNRGAWKYLEESVRAWVSCGGHTDLTVITGPIYGAGKRVIGSTHVAVPDSFYKIVYDTQAGRAVGFVLPNQKIGATIPDLQVYVKPIVWIEGETGLRFFANLDPRAQATLKAAAGTAWGHIATCPTSNDD